MRGTRGECRYQAEHNKAPSMYEMEGALPGRVAPGSPVAWLTWHMCQVSQATGEPGATRPGKAPSISYMEGALLCSAWYRHSPRVPRMRKHGDIDKNGQAGLN